MKSVHSLAGCCLCIILVNSLLFLSSCKKDDNMPGEPPVVKPDLIFYSINADGQLSKHNAKAVETAISTVAVSGLQPGETIMAIDFRPATGELYGLGSTSRLYIINHVTGNARAVAADPFTPAVSGTIAGFDFNPTVDRIRLVTATGQNLRLHPETGLVAAADGNINGTAGAAISAVAYTYNKAGAAATTLFDIDMTTKKLYKQSPPNNGTLVEVGGLGIMPTGEAGFDISPDAVALAGMQVDGKSSLFSIDTATGKAVKLGNFPGSSMTTGIAIPTNAVAYAVDETNNLLIFNPFSTDVPVSKAIAGLVAGDDIAGIDFRPVNGQLYALGKAGNLYTLNASSGAAALVGAGAFGTLNGSYFGFDFNPTVDRIRVVSSSGQNIRLHPVTGLIAATDLPLNPGSPNVSAAAYSNNFAGAASTVLYDIDCNVDKLYKQLPPNDGTLAEIGSLGINIESANGFDIGSASGTAWGIFTVGGKAGLYSVDLTTGTATKKSDFAAKVKGFTVGLSL
ncbi:MAG: DUF4394 domain-containing protein [Ferruginibacter sp.]